MIVDTSVIVALLKGEADGPRLSAALSAPEAKHISAATFLETAIVVDANRDPVMSRRFDELLRDTSIEIAPVTERQARIAREAYRDFGRGSGHPAGLNFGDCFAYALAKDLGEPLLFKGDDFIHTDIEPALK
ncbi:MAG: type II toxin-antitoxin system VapC family toxin [Rhodospirillaceae bacterium]|nr:type II toxin-antitoxin system VapC family toxin [Rhodospirillaceae bacterium]